MALAVVGRMGYRGKCDNRSRLGAVQWLRSEVTGLDEPRLVKMEKHKQKENTF